MSGPRAAQLLGVSLRTIYTLTAQRRLHWVRIGRASRIAVAELERLVIDLTEADE